MKKIKSVSTIIILISLFSLIFNGCSNLEGQSKKKQILLFSNKIEAVSTYNKLIEKFEKENPDIEVTLSAPPDATTVLKTKLVKNDAPDIISLSGSTWDYVETNLLEDLTGKLDFDKVDDVYIQMMKDFEIEPKDGIYSVPYALNASGVIYNKDIFNKLNLKIPNTWDELIELCKTLQSKDVIPFYFTLKDSWTDLPMWNQITSTLVSVDELKEVNQGKANFNDLYSESADKIAELLKYGHSDNFGVGYNDGNTAFAQEKSAMYLQGSYAIPTILNVNQNINLGMFPLPVTNNPDDNRLVSGIDVYFAIPKESKNKEESIRFINFLLREENAKQYIDEQSAFSAVKNVNQTDSKFDILNQWFKEQKIVNFQDNFYPPELPASDMIQTYLLDNDKNKLLNNFQKEWEKANRKYMTK